ncbi:CRISPR-associated endonuclease Cas2 [Candidatus Daviesbacteria bacterium RIFCSPLOWO2_01_FULL_43_38]|uniref:CRISPR-associated endonuclease Cas2 n=2 Tax=Candidatus Daviesiibacteriota TaxID=1752718 RepID=A0A1F5K771_9BACT|nr:MAG: repressor in the phenylacetic acid catabolic pathway [Candidatus Daviesbacteria bacterium GW2011_GWA2_42_7]OGE20302.1 MAG: CRISPR-associated endonuclease Cas2 [Candidatus Daviesbacteria bacterium RIFCSPHIGHO2_01_FULL_43_17]OGE36665.1 MAG: CRISPR-associated endonuclease Cas2 [Candidatus Daviesbacteria bacterium RIFCSPHIGHO2_12_FULL_43_11]OGE63240.1 MAG: CRISPR-associated endonuclease Cas2 [Candidatus Daviesbacteria bacterium RIFCSPLOWO2_01_FULL_43_38]
MGTKKSLTNVILLALEKSVDGYVRFEDFTYNSWFYARGYERNLKKPALSQALRRLRENGLVELLSDGELTLRLTDRGKDRALWMKMKMEDEKWDGKWRLVCWDIPEKRRAARNLLRHKLKQLGFQCFQKSVWGCKKDCTKPLRDFIRQVGIEDWVMVVESDDIGR